MTLTRLGPKDKLSPLILIRNYGLKKRVEQQKLF